MELVISIEQGWDVILDRRLPLVCFITATRWYGIDLHGDLGLGIVLAVGHGADDQLLEPPVSRRQIIYHNRRIL